MTKAEKLLLTFVVLSTIVALFCEAFPINLLTKSNEVYKAEELIGMIAAVAALMFAAGLAYTLATRPPKK